VVEKGVHSLGLCRLGRRELVYLGLLVSVERPVICLSVERLLV
jgi:hypothetical protein